jgi:ribonuclease D
MPQPLLTPRYGLPALVISNEELAQVIFELSEGHGPIAIDAERASGYRFSQRAYLIQIFRRGGGLHLIDPILANDVTLWRKMGEVFSDQEWIIHASTQDLACLREVGLEPRILFDTELGGRLAGCERVGLGPLVESLLDLSLAKEHSAVDWSIRPLKEEWLNYAALDVDVLVDLRDEVEALLDSQGKLEWAKEEFASILQAPPAPARLDPWRRTSGMHKIRDRATLTIIRDMWLARSNFAEEIDISSGRVFNDDSLIELATKRPKEINDFAHILTKRTRLTNHPIEAWFDIYRASLVTPVEDQPELRIASKELPPVKIWAQRNAPGYARVTHARAAVSNLASELSMPTENLLSPELLRRICWQAPPSDLPAALLALGARAWQVNLVSPVIGPALLETTPLILELAAVEGEQADQGELEN